MTSFIIAPSITQPIREECAFEALQRWEGEGGSQRRGYLTINGGIIAMGTRLPCGLGVILSSIMLLEGEAKEALKSAARSWMNGFNHSGQWLRTSEATLAHDIRELIGITPGDRSVVDDE